MLISYQGCCDTEFKHIILPVLPCVVQIEIFQPGHVTCQSAAYGLADKLPLAAGPASIRNKAPLAERARDMYLSLHLISYACSSWTVRIYFNVAATAAAAAASLSGSQRATLWLGEIDFASTCQPASHSHQQPEWRSACGYVKREFNICVYKWYGWRQQHTDAGEAKRKTAKKPIFISQQQPGRRSAPLKIFAGDAWNLNSLRNTILSSVAHGLSATLFYGRSFALVVFIWRIKLNGSSVQFFLLFLPFWHLNITSSNNFRDEHSGMHK